MGIFMVKKTISMDFSLKKNRLKKTKIVAVNGKLKQPIYFFNKLIFT